MSEVDLIKHLIIPETKCSWGFLLFYGYKTSVTFKSRDYRDSDRLNTSLNDTPKVKLSKLNYRYMKS